MALWPRPYAAADPPLRLRPASSDMSRVPRHTLRSRSPHLRGPAGSTTTAPRPSINCPTRRPSTARTPTTANYYEYSGDPFFQERVDALFSWIADADTPTELYHLPLMRQTAERLVSIGLCSPAALAGASWEEVLCRWDSDLGYTMNSAALANLVQHFGSGINVRPAHWTRSSPSEHAMGFGRRPPRQPALRQL